MSATSNDDGKPVSTVVSEANFLVGAAKHFNFNIGHIDFRDFPLWGVNDEQLLSDRPLVFGPCKKDAVPRDLEFVSQLVRVIFATVNRPLLSMWIGVEISSTRKSVTLALRTPPIPSVFVA